MRAVIPGYIQYRYRDGTPAGHTKPFFNDYRILTVQGVIIFNALLFMHKLRHFPSSLPPSIRETIASNAPVPGSNHETNQDWLSKYNNHIYQNTLFFKGPLLTTITEFSELITIPNLLNYNIYKNDLKKYLLNAQSRGDIEWPSSNFPLYNIPGLRRGPQRQAKNVITYQEN